MATFKNINFKTRNYECTNIVYCIAETAPDANYAECNEVEILHDRAQHLFTQNGVQYFGYL